MTRLLLLYSNIVNNFSHLGLNRMQESIDLGGLGLGHQLNASVREVSYVSRQLKIAGEPSAGRSKPNPLN
jgi:hypothetical protein